MPIAPAVPLGGLAGFKFLERTYAAQSAVFNTSPDIEREVAYFLENAGNVISAQDLVSDRRLLDVALTAFGLEEDLDKGAFIRKVLEEGTLSQENFANRLVEPAYAEIADFLGFGNFGSTLIHSTVREEIVARYQNRRFELAVGESDLDLRLAFNFKREAVEIVSSPGTEDSLWLRLIGSQPLRSVIEGAFFLPQSFALIDVDQQIEEIKSRADQLFGTTSPLSLLDSGNLDKMVERFLLRQQTLGLGGGGATSGSAALSILQSSTLGAGAQQSLFASNFL